MNHSVDWWLTYRHQTGNKYVARYLALSEKHCSSAASDYQALDSEQANLMSAISLAFQLQKWAEVVHFVKILDDYFYTLGYWKELRYCLNQAIFAAQERGNKGELASFLHNQAMLAQEFADYATANDLYQRSLNLERELGRTKNLSDTLHQIAMIAHEQGNFAEAERLYQQCIIVGEEIADQEGLLKTWGQLAALAEDRGEYKQAEVWYTNVLKQAEALGIVAQAGQAKWGLGNIALRHNDIPRAHNHYKEALTIFCSLQDRKNESGVLHQLGVVAQRMGNYDQARQYYAESLKIKQELGMPLRIGRSLAQLGRISILEGKLEEAEHFWNQAAKIAEQIGDLPGLSNRLYNLALLHEETGRRTQAVALLEQVVALDEQIDNLRRRERHRRKLNDIKTKLTTD